MSILRHRLLLSGGFLLMGLFSVFAAKGQSASDLDKSAANLMVVLRESHGLNKQEESLRPIGKGKVALSDGKIIEIDPGWFDYLGDMHIRFVFDSPKTMFGANPDDLRRLNLTPEAALKLAIDNIERVYGKPHAVAFSGALMEVKGQSPDLNSSYFLDREYWGELNKQYQEGLVAAPAKRGGLLYVPLVDAKAVDILRKNVGQLYESSGNMRVSSALYLFKDGHWTVFQAPVAK
ncbi:MAG: hypothetical protein JWN73_515 [Betaproteobacteria bacterium]|nr:hypothetical protein [Betaproteobacteria bacterium]